jgi:hypothetical protein
MRHARQGNIVSVARLSGHFRARIYTPPRNADHA